MMYTYYIPNQWHTRVNSIRPGLTHYIHYGDTYIPCYHSELYTMLQYYEALKVSVETGELLQHL